MKYCKYAPWGQCYKTFYFCELRIFIMSQSVCPWQAFPPQSIVCDKARSLPESGASERFFSRVCSCFTYKHQTSLKLAWDKLSSLLRKVVTHGLKKFYNIGPWSVILTTLLKQGCFKNKNIRLKCSDMAPLSKINLLRRS